MTTGGLVRRRDALDRGLEQDGRGGAVDVVVAVDEDRLAAATALLDAGDGRGHAEQQRRDRADRRARDERNCRASGRIPRADKQLRDRRRAAESAARQPRSTASGIGGSPRPSRFGVRERCCRSRGLLVAVVDDDAAEVGGGFHQVLEAVVPVGGGLEEEHDALVGEAELQVAGLADVLQQRLGVVEVDLFVFGEGVVAQLLEQDGDVDFSRTTSLMVMKGAPAALACSTKSFQPSASSSSNSTVGTSSVT